MSDDRDSRRLYAAQKVADEWVRMRRSLFPAWRSSHGWRLALASFRDQWEMAIIDFRTKTVFFSDRWGGPAISTPGPRGRWNSSGAAIIGVMCHVVTKTRTHTRLWYERMIEAARRLRRTDKDTSWQRAGMRRSPAEQLAQMVEHNAKLDVRKPGASRDLIDWSKPVLEIQVDREQPGAKVTLVPYIAVLTIRRRVEWRGRAQRGRVTTQWPEGTGPGGRRRLALSDLCGADRAVRAAHSKHGETQPARGRREEFDDE